MLLLLFDSQHDQVHAQAYVYEASKGVRDAFGHKSGQPALLSLLRWPRCDAVRVRVRVRLINIYNMANEQLSVVLICML